MTASIFLVLLSAFAVISGLITEGIKNITKDKANLSYNILAIIVSLVVGAIGTGLYYQFSEIAFNANNIICIVLMGLASGLVSMVGFDKVKQAILQITGKEE